MSASVTTQAFDLNDMDNEPSDEQLQALMDAVAAEAIRRAELAAQTMQERVRTEMALARNREAAR